MVFCVYIVGIDACVFYSTNGKWFLEHICYVLINYVLCNLGIM